MTQAQGRYNIYVNIHKGLRAFMADTLVRLGRTDWCDEGDSSEAIDQVRTLLSLCHSHVQHENDFVHKAMESRWPGASGRVAGEHVEHVAQIRSLIADVDAIEAASGLQRALLGAAMYRQIAAFTAHNLEHMAYEEKDHNAVLWATHTDDEIRAIEQALVASIPPATMGLCLRWMLPAMNHGERVTVLSDMRMHAPVDVFAGTMQMIEALLSVADWDKLCAALDLTPTFRVSTINA